MSPGLEPAQVGVRLLPFLVVAWTRASLALVLPGFIETYQLSIARAGTVGLAIEMGSFSTMLILAFVMDRIGAGRVLQLGLPTLGLALLATSFTRSVLILPVFLVLVGAGIAMSASSVNTLMAASGPRRNVYLGWLHMSFSAFSMVVPLVAGYMVAAYNWQTFYWLLCGLSFLILLSYRLVEGRAAAVESPNAVTGTAQSLMRGCGEALWRNASIYLGVFFLVGVQGIAVTWSYMYAIDQHGVGHAWAAVAPASIWLGVLVGRGINIRMSRTYSLRKLMLGSCGAAIVVVTGEYALTSFWATLACFAGLGIGVSGAFQHGTAWASERTPEQVGAASTFVMASAALGVGVWPWLMGVSAEAWGFETLPLVAGAGLVLALISFAATIDGVRPSHQLGA